MNMLIKQISPKQNQELIKQFEDADLDGSGALDVEEMEQAMTNAGFQFSKEEILGIMNDLDYDHNEKLNYREFLAATVNI